MAKIIKRKKKKTVQLSSANIKDEEVKPGLSGGTLGEDFLLPVDVCQHW